MSELITSCPHCFTSFTVAHAQLKMANGMVRCGACLTTFDALHEENNNHPDNKASEQPLPFDGTIHIPEPGKINIPDNLNPDYLKLSHSTKPGIHTGSGLLLLLFITTSLLQLVHFNSDNLYRHPDFGHLVSRFCQISGCPTPQPINLNAIRSNKLQIYSHNKIANALIVDAIVENRASFAQPFPPLLLQFENLQGKIINQRVFQPEHYRQGNLANNMLFPANSSIHFQLEIVDPGPSATNYALLVAK